MTLRFGDCLLAPDRRQLLRDGQPTTLTPKGYQLLELLLERRPAAVSKAEIHDRLWPDTFVSEVNLPALINEIRAVTGDDARTPRYVRTVRGFGYAFCGEAVEEGEDRPRGAASGHCLFWDERELRLREGRNVIGRGTEADLRVDATSVSRRHACIVVKGPQAELEDLESKNGTFVGGDRLEGRRALDDGNEIRLGSVRLVYRRLHDSRPTATII